MILKRLARCPCKYTATCTFKGCRFLHIKGPKPASGSKPSKSKASMYDCSDDEVEKPKPNAKPRNNHFPKKDVRLFSLFLFKF